MRELRLEGDSRSWENDWFTSHASSTSSTVFYSLENSDDQLNNGTGDTNVVGDDAANQNPMNFVFNGSAPINIHVFSGPTYYAAPEAHPNPFGQYNNHEMQQQQRAQSGQMAQPPPFQANPTVYNDDILNDILSTLHYSPPRPNSNFTVAGQSSSTNGATSSQSPLHGSAVQAPVFPEPIFTPPTPAFPTISSTINNATQRSRRGRGRPRGSSRIPRYQF